jgi:citrate synthase
MCGARLTPPKMSAPRAPEKGLEHVVMGDSALALVQGETGGLSYRGFGVAELVGHASYEAVLHLLLHGDPPTAAEETELRRNLVARRAIDPGLGAVVDALPTDLAPLEALRTSLSAMGTPAFGYPPTLDQGLDLVAQAPILLTRFVRRAHAQPALSPRPELDHVANYLYLLSGRVPEPARVRALETYFILLADHGMNASTFALRVVLSTNADLISGATAALAALKGPLHGGAPSKVSDMLDAIGSPTNASTWIDGALARKERLMGFGHRAYKTEDPRAVLLHAQARTSAAPERLLLAETVESVALAALQRARPGQRLYTNVEYYGAIVLESAGLPRDLFTPTFGLARTAGWAAHALEQASDNRLIRPEVRYTGPAVGRRWPAPGPS